MLEKLEAAPCHTRQTGRSKVTKGEVVVVMGWRGYLFLALFACTQRPPLLSPVSPPAPSSAAPAPGAFSGTESFSGPH